MGIKDGIFEMLGKTIKEVIINEGCGPYPNYHIFIVFSDDSFYEFYGGGHVNSANGLRPDSAIDYAKVFNSCSSSVRYFKGDDGKYSTDKLQNKL